MMPLILRPLGLFLRAEAPTEALPLAGGRLAFVWAERVEREPKGWVRRKVGTISDHRAWAQQARRETELEEVLDRLCRPRLPFAGVDLVRPRLMGVVNTTPDSFSDGGRYLQAEAAVVHARALVAEGVDFLDIGGESTRPGAETVAPEAEQARVLPVLAALADAADAAVPLSIDSRRAATQRAALAAGATIINDIAALADPQSLALAAASGAAVVLMHMQGEPATMLDAPHYDDVALDVYDFLAARVEACHAAGIDSARIAVDPGIGFGKTREHNLALLRQLSLFHGLGVTLLLGVSRKRFIAQTSRGESPTERLPGTLAAGLAGLNQGVHILRIHDAAATVQARAVWEAMTSA